jgi:hypothetical protein
LQQHSAMFANTNEQSAPTQVGGSIDGATAAASFVATPRDAAMLKEIEACYKTEDPNRPEDPEMPSNRYDLI